MLLVGGMDKVRNDRLLIFVDVQSYTINYF